MAECYVVILVLLNFNFLPLEYVNYWLYIFHYAELHNSWQNSVYLLVASAFSVNNEPPLLPIIVAEGCCVLVSLMRCRQLCYWAFASLSLCVHTVLWPASPWLPSSSSQCFLMNVYPAPYIKSFKSFYWWTVKLWNSLFPFTEMETGKREVFVFMVLPKECKSPWNWRTERSD